MGALSITSGQLAQANAIAAANPNNLAVTWLFLSQAGDQYAEAAYNGLSNQNSMFNAVINSSNAVSGVTSDQQQQIAINNLSGYLSIISNSPPNSDGTYPLPNTTSIETNYANAVTATGAPLSAAIDFKCGQNRPGR
jgi:hypothetical protein